MYFGKLICLKTILYCINDWLYNIIVCQVKMLFKSITWCMSRDVQVFRLVFVQKSTENGRGLCGTSANQTHVYVTMHIYLYQFVLQFMLPATVIFVCNIVILYRIYRVRYGTNHYLRRDAGTAAEPSRRQLLNAPVPAAAAQLSKHQQTQQPSASPLQRQVST